MILTTDDRALLRALHAQGVPGRGLRRLVDLRLIRRRAPLGPEYDGTIVDRRLEYARWLREHGRLDDGTDPQDAAS